MYKNGMNGAGQITLNTQRLTTIQTVITDFTIHTKLVANTFKSIDS